MPRTPAHCFFAVLFLFLLVGDVAWGAYPSFQTDGGVPIWAIVGSWFIGLIGGLFSVQILRITTFLTAIYAFGAVALGIYAITQGRGGLLGAAIVGCLVITLVGGILLQLQQRLERATMQSWMDRQGLHHE